MCVLRWQQQRHVTATRSRPISGRRTLTAVCHTTYCYFFVIRYHILWFLCSPFRGAELTTAKDIGKDLRIRSVDGRALALNSRTGQWPKRDDSTGRFNWQEDGQLYKGVTREKDGRKRERIR